MTLEFHGFPKIPRLRRPIVVTEKIDGTNAAIQIRDLAIDNYVPDVNEKYVANDEIRFGVSAQSRKRIITPHDDNYGFARWVWDNADKLVELLGEGIHFGEWWGRGIQRGYDMKNARFFSLFNTARWGELSYEFVEKDKSRVVLNSVPVLAEYDVFDTRAIEDEVDILRDTGSVASPGYMNPEGVVVFHKAGNTLFKRLLENDDLPKGIAENV